MSSPSLSISKDITDAYAPPTINVNMERNSRGVTWGVSIVGARSTEEAMQMLDKTRTEMAHRFGDVNEVR